jgi:hypothetical protein
MDDLPSFKQRRRFYNQSGQSKFIVSDPEILLISRENNNNKSSNQSNK